MTPTLIVLALAALAVAIVVWAIRRKPDATRTGPQDGDTAWNDPVSPEPPAHPAADAFANAPPPEEPRP